MITLRIMLFLFNAPMPGTPTRLVFAACEGLLIGEFIRRMWL